MECPAWQVVGVVHVCGEFVYNKCLEVEHVLFFILVHTLWIFYGDVALIHSEIDNPSSKTAFKHGLKMHFTDFQ